MAEFKYRDMFPGTEDTTEYRLLSADHVSTAAFDGVEVLKVSAEGLTFLAEEAFNDVSHLLRSSHLKQLAAILDDPESSANDRYVALEMLKNAVIAAEGIFPMCQDTGTAISVVCRFRMQDVRRQMAANLQQCFDDSSNKRGHFVNVPEYCSPSVIYNQAMDNKIRYQKIQH